MFSSLNTGSTDFRLTEGSNERIQIEAALRSAIANRELWVAYQPVVSLGTGTAIVSVEKDGIRHFSGTGVGGGTLLGLSKHMLGVSRLDTLEAMASRGVATPVIPGVMPPTNAERVAAMSAMNGTEFPAALRMRLEAAGEDLDARREIAIDVATRLGEALFAGELFACLLDQQRLSALTQTACTVQPCEGGAYTYFNGAVAGTLTRLRLANGGSAPADALMALPRLPMSYSNPNPPRTAVRPSP